jgi:putative DNA primase/helicase
MTTQKQQQSNSYISDEHRAEFRASGIDDITADLNFWSFNGDDENDRDEVFLLLKHDPNHKNDSTPSGQSLNDLANALYGGGWVCQGDSGVIAKLNNPRKVREQDKERKKKHPFELDENGKPKTTKYESPRDVGIQSFIPHVSVRASYAIAENLLIDKGEYQKNRNLPAILSLDAIDEGFWDWFKTTKHYLLVTEGSKNPCSIISAGFPAIGLNGIWGWGKNEQIGGGWGKAKDEKGFPIKEIHPELLPFLNGREIILTLDCDENRITESSTDEEIEKINKAVESATKSKKSFYWTINGKDRKGKYVKTKFTEIKWSTYKGIDDYLGAQVEDKREVELTKLIQNRSKIDTAKTPTPNNKNQPASAPDNDDKNDDNDDKKDGKPTGGDKNPPALHISKKVFKDLFEDAIRFDASVKQYWRYDGKGKWVICSDEYIFGIVQGYLEEIAPKEFTPGYVRNVIEFARKDFLHDGWTEASNLLYIPFENGVLEIKTHQILDHSPDYGFTWQLPRSYSAIDAKWSNIDSFLNSLCVGNQQLKDIAIAFCAAILAGRSDLQRFLYLFGSGANGKGALMTLLSMIVGKENTHSTTMADLNGNQFEPANLKGKRLAIMTDEDKRVGSLSVFKSATGQDPIRFERKGKDASNFIFKGMFVIAANSPTFVGNSNFAIKRRKIDFPCLARIAESDRRDLTAEFEADLTAFTTYLLSIPDEWVTATIRGASTVDAVKDLNWEMTIREDSIAAFYEDKLIVDPEGSIGCGDLYAKYKSYCDDSGSKPKGLNNFTPDLLELCNDSLGLSISKKHTMTGKVIKGLRLRTDNDVDDRIPRAEARNAQRKPTSEVPSDKF